MYTDQTPIFDINLGVIETVRWKEVIEADKQVVVRLAKEADEDYAAIPSIAQSLLRGALSIGYRMGGGRYKGELRSWADALNRSFGEVLLLNCAYEMSHLGVGMNSIFGCTAGVVKTESGPMHVRSMDWPLPGIGPATRIFRFHNHGERPFYSVGVSGYVGVLSGMLPGGYSVTLNWAPPVERPTFDFGPAFLIREVLETCDTYEEAVDALSGTKLSTSVFFTVCGVENNQACTIERTREDVAVRKIRNNVITQGNHHVARKFKSNNDYEEPDLLEDSEERAAVLREALLELDTGDLEEIAGSLDTEPVQNEDSYQQMAFCPRTGGIKVWRWV